MMQASEKGRLSGRRVWEDFGSPELPVPIERIIKSQNISVRFSPFDDELSGMAVIKDGQAVIGVNALHHPNRQRFTMAHELGHHVMHSDRLIGTVHLDKGFELWRGEGPTLLRGAMASQGVDTIEIEANAFASEILLPTDLITKIDELMRFDLDDEVTLLKFSKRFKVSPAALRFRLLSLR